MVCTRPLLSNMTVLGIHVKFEGGKHFYTFPIQWDDFGARNRFPRGEVFLKKHHYRDVSTHAFTSSSNWRMKPAIFGVQTTQKEIVKKKHLDHLAAFIAFNVPLLFTNKSLPEIARTPKLLAMKLVVNGVKNSYK